MKKEERITLIVKKLNELYPRPKSPLNHTDPYTLLIAVVLSARSTDAKVNEITKDLFKVAGTPQAMVKLSEEAVRHIIRPCGLSPSKAKALIGLSKILIEKHGGKVPMSFEALEALPGVGHKTASVVMSQAFGVEAFPVDTHIYRLARRWKLSKGNNVKAVEKDLKAVFPKKLWGSVHLQMLYYAREHCNARKCGGKGCLICKALINGVKEKIILNF